VASKHKSAPWFLKQGFFEGIKSFKEFEARTGKLADTVEMGDALEILVEGYLHLDKVLNAKDGLTPLAERQYLRRRSLPGGKLTCGQVDKGRYSGRDAVAPLPEAETAGSENPPYLGYRGQHVVLSLPERQRIR
jgi:hypothetical protein